MTSSARPVLAQLFAADRRVAGHPGTAAGWHVAEVVEAPGTTRFDPGLLPTVDAVSRDYAADPQRARRGTAAAAEPVLKQVRLPGGLMMVAQFSDAGIDRTGRPGHTMHALVHGAPLRARGGAQLRPPQLFGSPMWLRPVGADAVEAATVHGAWFALPAGPLRPDELVGDAFLTDLDRPERITVLPLVIEAFRAALLAEAVCVLVVRTATEAAQWLALLTGLVDPVSASRLRFSTREDADAPAHLRSADFDVVGVPPTPGWCPPDRADVVRSRLLVVDTLRPPPERADGSWELGGVTVRRSPWTDLAETVLMSAAVAAEVRARLDRLADGVEGIAAEPTWGLPAAALWAGVDVPDRSWAAGWVVSRWPGDPAPPTPAVEALVAALGPVLGDDDPALARLAARLGRGVPTEFADAIVSRAVSVGLADLASDVPAPRLARPLSPAGAAVVAAGLPGLLTWLPSAPLRSLLAAVVRVQRFATDAELPRRAIRAALQPGVAAVVARLVDPTFDPTAAGWPPLTPQLWQDVFADAVSDALMVPDESREVSPATHTWLTPCLGPRDRPEVAATSHRLEMSAYGNRRSAWLGTSGDPWRSAVFAVGMLHVNVVRFGTPLGVAAARAMDRAFAGHPIPVDVAAAILDAIDPVRSEARLLVASAALIDGEFRTDQQRLAHSLRNDLSGQADPMAALTAPLYVQLMHGRLTTGRPAETLDAANVRAASYIARRLGHLQPPAMRGATRIMLLQWGLRLPVHALFRPDGSAIAGELPSTLRSVAPDPDAVDLALARLLGHADDAVFEVIAQLLVRGGLVLSGASRFYVEDPYLRFLARRGPTGVPQLLTGPIATWLSERGEPAYLALDAAWDGVIGDLGGRGWASQVRALEDARAQMWHVLDPRFGAGHGMRRRGTA